MEDPRLDLSQFTIKQNSAKGDCMFESIRDSMDYLHLPHFSHETLRQMTCDFYKKLFVHAQRNADGSYHVNEGAMIFHDEGLQTVKDVYRIPDDLWNVIFMQVTYDMIIKKYNRHDFDGLKKDDYVRICESENLPSDGTVDKLKHKLFQLEIFHFEQICKPLTWAGISDAAILSVKLHLNIYIYKRLKKNSNELINVFHFIYNIRRPTIYLLFVDGNHFEALLPKSSERERKTRNSKRRIARETRIRKKVAEWRKRVADSKTRNMFPSSSSEGSTLKNNFSSASTLKDFESSEHDVGTARNPQYISDN